MSIAFKHLSLSHMGDDNATEIMTVNSRTFNIVTERSRLETELATISHCHTQKRTESESSKQLAVAGQISTCKLSQTNPRSQSEETSVPQIEKSRDLEFVSLTKELQDYISNQFRLRNRDRSMRLSWHKQLLPTKTKSCSKENRSV